MNPLFQAVPGWQSPLHGKLSASSYQVGRLASTHLELSAELDMHRTASMGASLRMKAQHDGLTALTPLLAECCEYRRVNPAPSSMLLHTSALLDRCSRRTPAQRSCQQQLTP